MTTKSQDLHSLLANISALQEYVGYPQEPLEGSRARSTSPRLTRDVAGGVWLRSRSPSPKKGKPRGTSKGKAKAKPKPKGKSVAKPKTRGRGKTRRTTRSSKRKSSRSRSRTKSRSRSKTRSRSRSRSPSKRRSRSRSTSRGRTSSVVKGSTTKDATLQSVLILQYKPSKGKSSDELTYMVRNPTKASLDRVRKSYSDVIENIPSVIKDIHKPGKTYRSSSRLFMW